MLLFIAVTIHVNASNWLSKIMTKMLSNYVWLVDKFYALLSKHFNKKNEGYKSINFSIFIESLYSFFSLSTSIFDQAIFLKQYMFCYKLIYSYLVVT